MKSDYPYDIMDGVGQQYAELYSSHLECPPEFFFHSFLTCMGSVLGDRLTLCSEIRPQPRQYTILLGESADAHKSTAITKTVELFSEHIKTCDGVGSAEGLATQFQQGDNLLLVYDEFKHFHDKAMAKESTLLTCANTLFDNNKYQSAVKDKKLGAHIRNGHLSILGASTVRTYDTMWTAQFTDIGFINRLWIVPGGSTRQFSIPDLVPEESQESIKLWIGAIIAHVGDYLALLVEADALREYHTWYMALPNSIHAKRIDTYALRFACLFAACDMERCIKRNVVERVIALCNWQLGVRELHDPIDADNQIAKMEEMIRRCLHRRPETPGELKRLTHASRCGIWCFDKSLDNLCNANEVVVFGDVETGRKKYKEVKESAQV